MRTSGWLYYRVDLRLRRNPRWLRLSTQARDLWHQLVSWSKEYETDGHLPLDALPEIPSQPIPTLGACVAELVVQGFLEEAPGALLLHDFTDWQVSRLGAQREKAAARQRAYYHRQRARRLEAKRQHTVSADAIPDVSKNVSTPSAPNADDDMQALDNAALFHVDAKPNVRSDAPRLRDRVRVRKEKEKTSKEKEKAAGRPSAQDLVDLWNRESGTLPKVHSLTSDRRRKAERRLSEHPDLAWWGQALTGLRSSAFCQGDNDRGWRATFDWLIRNDANAQRLVEGAYQRAPGSSLAPRTRSTLEAGEAFLRQRRQ